jgi:ABC-type multidrug transport system fused ATPase/permease subunit
MFTDIIRAVHQSLSVLAAEKRPFYFAIFLCILGGGIELIGVGTLYPFLSLLSKPELIDSNATLHRLYAYGGFENVNRFLLWSGWLTLAVFFLTSVFMFLKNAYITRFCVRQTARVSVSMLEAYLRKPMLFHVESNSGALSKDVIGQTDQFTFGVLISVMTLFGDGAILIVLIGLILWVDFNVGLVVTLTLGLILSMALVLTRDKMHKLGVQNDNANSARFAFCVSALQSIKEIKTSGKESFFSGLFRIHAQAQARSYASLFIIQLLPPAIVQFIAAGAVISMALYYIASGVELSTIVPTLVLYAVAGYRLMPSVGKLANALSQLRQFQPVIGNISRVLNSASHSSRADPAQVAEPAILPSAVAALFVLSANRAQAKPPWLICYSVSCRPTPELCLSTENRCTMCQNASGAQYLDMCRSRSILLTALLRRILHSAYPQQKSIRNGCDRSFLCAILRISWMPSLPG